MFSILWKIELSHLPTLTFFFILIPYSSKFGTKKLMLKLSQVFYGIETILCIVLFLESFCSSDPGFKNIIQRLCHDIIIMIYSIDILIIIVFDIHIINIWYFVKRVKFKFNTNTFDAKIIFALRAKWIKTLIKH